MRRFLPSLNPEGNLFVDSSVEDEMYRILFPLTNANPYLEDGELFTRLDGGKWRSASPSLISDVIRYSDTDVSSISRRYSQAYTDSDSIA